jgi:hypothetical protein
VERVHICLVLHLRILGHVQNSKLHVGEIRKSSGRERPNAFRPWYAAVHHLEVSGAGGQFEDLEGRKLACAKKARYTIGGVTVPYPRVVERQMGDCAVLNI